MKLDKKAHFLAGAAIAALLIVYGVPVMWAFFISVVIAGVKELIDLMGYGTPDKYDFMVTVAGASLVLPLLFI